MTSEIFMAVGSLVPWTSFLTNILSTRLKKATPATTDRNINTSFSVAQEPNSGLSCPPHPCGFISHTM